MAGASAGAAATGGVGAADAARAPWNARTGAPRTPRHAGALILAPYTSLLDQRTACAAPLQTRLDIAIVHHAMIHAAASGRR